VTKAATRKARGIFIAITIIGTTIIITITAGTGISRSKRVECASLKTDLIEVRRLTPPTPHTGASSADHQIINLITKRFRDHVNAS